MERLTERLGDYNNPKEICAVWVKNYDYVSAAHRLADYEDIADTVGGFDRLRELAEADKGGRLVVLPCKVGDGLWTFCSHPETNFVFLPFQADTRTHFCSLGEPKEEPHADDHN